MREIFYGVFNIILVFSYFKIESNTNFDFAIASWIHVWNLFDSENQGPVHNHGNSYFFISISNF